MYPLFSSRLIIIGEMKLLGVVANVLDYNNVLSEFKFQSPLLH